MQVFEKPFPSPVAGPGEDDDLDIVLRGHGLGSVQGIEDVVVVMWVLRAFQANSTEELVICAKRFLAIV